MSDTEKESSLFEAAAAEASNVLGRGFTQIATFGRLTGLYGEPIDRAAFDTQAVGFRVEDGGPIVYRDGMTDLELEAEKEAHRRAQRAAATDAPGIADDAVRFAVDMLMPTPVDVATTVVTGGAFAVVAHANRARKAAKLAQAGEAVASSVEKASFAKRFATGVAPQVVTSVAGEAFFASEQGHPMTAPELAVQTGQALLFGAAIQKGGDIVGDLLNMRAKAQAEFGELTPENAARVEAVLSEEIDPDKVYDAVVNPPETQIPAVAPEQTRTPRRIVVQKDQTHEGMSLRHESEFDAAVIAAASKDTKTRSDALRYIKQSVPDFRPKSAAHRKILDDVLSEHTEALKAESAAGGYVDGMPIEVPDSGLLDRLSSRIEDHKAFEAAKSAEAVVAKNNAAKPVEPEQFPDEPAPADDGTPEQGAVVGGVGEPLIDPKYYEARLAETKAAEYPSSAEVTKVRREASEVATRAARKRLRQAMYAGRKPWKVPEPPAKDGPLELSGADLMDQVTNMYGRPNVFPGSTHYVGDDKWRKLRFGLAGVKDPSRRASVPGVPSLSSIQQFTHFGAIQKFYDFLGKTGSIVDEAKSVLNDTRPALWADIHKAMWGVSKDTPSGNERADSFARKWYEWYGNTADTLREHGLLVGQVAAYAPHDMDFQKMLRDPIGFKELLLEHLDWARYNMARESDAAKRKFLDDLYDTISKSESSMTADEVDIARQLKRREIHFKDQAGEWDFINKFGRGSFQEVLIDKMRKYTVLESAIPYYGPDYERTMFSLLNEAADQATREAQYLAARGAQIDAEIKATKDKTVKAALETERKQLKAAAKSAPTLDEIKQWRDNMTRVHEVAHGQYDNVETTVVNSLSRATDYGQSLWAAGKTMFTMLYTPVDIARTINAAATAMSYGGQANPLNQTRALANYMVETLDEVAQQGFGWSAAKQRKHWYEQLAITHYAMNSSYIDQIVDGANGAEAQRLSVRAGGAKAADAALGGLRKLQMLSLTNTAGRRMQISEFIHGMSTLLERSGGDFDSLRGMGYQGQAMHTRLAEAGWGKEQWSRLYDSRGDVTTKANLRLFGVSANLIDPLKVAAVDPSLARLYKLSLHNNLMEGTATSQVFERDMRRRGGMFSVIKSTPTKAGTAGRMTTDALSLFKMTMLRTASDYINTSTLNGVAGAMGAAPWMIAGGAATLMLGDVIKNNVSWDDIESDFEGYIANPYNHARFIEAMGVFPGFAETWRAFIERRSLLHADETALGYNASAVQDIATAAVENYFDFPLWGLATDGLNMVGQTEKSLKMGVTTEMWKERIADFSFARDMAPTTAPMFAAMGVSITDELMKAYDSDVYAYRDATKRKRLALLAETPSYDKMFAAEFNLFSRQFQRGTDAVLPSESDVQHEQSEAYGEMYLKGD